VKVQCRRGEVLIASSPGRIPDGFRYQQGDEFEARMYVADKDFLVLRKEGHKTTSDAGEEASTLFSGTVPEHHSHGAV
jgi:hypothetical protein